MSKSATITNFVRAREISRIKAFRLFGFGRVLNLRIAESFLGAREIGLDRAFQFFVTMTRMLIRLHRHKKLKPPSEAQFDAPKQFGYAEHGVF